MIVSINQPAYLPWLGYFHRIAVSDLHIVLDHVQFEKNSFVNRNKIRTKEGWIWLTVPLRTSGRFGHLPINRIEPVAESGWARKHWMSLRTNYSRAPHFTEHEAFLAKVYCATACTRLIDLMRMMNEYLLRHLRIETPLLYGSEMNAEGKKDELVLNLCKRVGATGYLSGPLGRNYLRESLLKDAGIDVIYHSYHHPIYPQAYPGFESCMSALDLLLNCGSQSRDILMDDQLPVRP